MSRHLINCALDDLVGRKRNAASDEQRAAGAALYAQLAECAKQAGVKRRDCVSVLNVAARAADTVTLHLNLTVQQFAESCDMSVRMVQRALDALAACDLLVVLKRGGGPVNRKRGNVTASGSQRWLKFADPYMRAADQPVDSDETHASDSANSRQLAHNSRQLTGTHFMSSSNHLPAEQVSAEARATAGRVSGGGNTSEARAPSDLWAEQLARAAAEQWLTSDEQASKVVPRNRQALISKRLPDCKRKLTDELLKWYPQTRHMITPGHELWGDLVTVLACLASGEGVNPVTWKEICTYLEAGQQPAMGATG